MEKYKSEKRRGDNSTRTHDGKKQTMQRPQSTKVVWGTPESNAMYLRIQSTRRNNPKLYARTVIAIQSEDDARKNCNDHAEHISYLRATYHL